MRSFRSVSQTVSECDRQTDRQTNEYHQQATDAFAIQPEHSVFCNPNILHDLSDIVAVLYSNDMPWLNYTYSMNMLPIKTNTSCKYFTDILCVPKYINWTLCWLDYQNPGEEILMYDKCDN